MTKLTYRSFALSLALLVSACGASGNSGSGGGDEGGSGDVGAGGKNTGKGGGAGGRSTSQGGDGAGGTVGDGGSVGGGGKGAGGAGDGGSGPDTGGMGAGGSGDGGAGPGDGGSGPAQGGSGPGGAGGGSGGSMMAAPDTAVLTSRYDNIRTGSTTTEKTLTVAKVGPGKFGLLFSRPYKGVVYGQPLYLPNMTIKGAKHNVVYLATEANIVYAWDADDPAASTPLWQKNFEAPFGLGGGYPSCADMKASGVAGITATPTIDLSQNKMFVMVKGANSTSLHALDLATGDESPPPQTVSAPMFDSRMHLNRPGLLLLDGVIYAGFGSHCDDNPYHGWIFAFDAKTLAPKGVYNVTPSGNRGAVWQSGMGLYGDSQGVVFCTGNGSVGGANLSESVVRVKQNGNALGMSEHYTPGNADALNGADNDLTAGVSGITGSNLILSGGKEGPLYVLDPSLAIKQTVKPPAAKDRDGLHSIASWTGSAGPMVYLWPSGGQLYAYGLAGGQLSLKSQGGPTLGHPGGVVTISSNGNMAGTGIVWANVPKLGDSWHGTAIGALYAFDATDVSKVLWNSEAAAADTLGNYAKFSPPMVANGKVYQATFSGKLMVYGPK